MQTRTKPTFLILAAIGLLTATGASAFDGRQVQLHITKACPSPGFTGAAGSYCTIESSNVSEIIKGSKVFYDQALGIPPGLLDSNVVLDAGGGNRALGRCTLDLSNGSGLCTFSDGTGQFAGFHARVAVSLDNTGLFHWDGTYRFGEGQDN